ncbi:hypothetical protein EJ05DRAFT_152276 [Pseudovirgaria hyperparasitica]|uniref:Uncharacterized protein n=1 Tax=Pseudovirgaria hyperparasitica TaxID=470096 RepID=A0A6A6VVK1_9PEZI|nr:uncharacterized protein EJ05DRAFT_152276 [Pseudovirgaria hyperparasitica]KAF2754195.1 hypothetical protein EJ05DRAFT_152276 [Pseudovirgaria hyperparasitica]
MLCSVFSSLGIPKSSTNMGFLDKFKEQKDKHVNKKTADDLAAHKDAGKHAGSVAEKFAKKSGFGMFSKEIGAGVKAIVEGKQKATSEAKAKDGTATVTTTETQKDPATGATTEIVATTTAAPPGSAPPATVDTAATPAPTTAPTTAQPAAPPAAA